MMAALCPISTKEIDRSRGTQATGCSARGIAWSCAVCRSVVINPPRKIREALRFWRGRRQAVARLLARKCVFPHQGFKSISLVPDYNRSLCTRTNAARNVKFLASVAFICAKHGIGQRFAKRDFDVAVVPGNAVTCPNQRHELVHKRRNCLDFASHRQTHANCGASMAGLGNCLLKTLLENRFSCCAEADICSHALTFKFLHLLRPPVSSDYSRCWPRPPRGRRFPGDGIFRPLRVVRVPGSTGFDGCHDHRNID